MAADFDIGALQDALDNWRMAELPSRSSDGVFNRLIQILASSKEAGAPRALADFMPLVRQVLRRQALNSYQAARLRVPIGEGWPTRDAWTQHGVVAHSEADGHAVLEAHPWRPAWFSDTDTPVFEGAFAEESVRLNWECPIDPFLREAVGFDTYVSPGQREAVRSAFLLPEGQTLIISLPTGAGKSLVAQAPVLLRGLEGPLTLCVVPTTALALDQARRMREALQKRERREPPPLAWHASLSQSDRDAIKAAIREGRQGILFCSPEAVNAALLPSLYDAARAGLMGYFVIDEAHLVSQWGDGFRPAFQLLAGVRRGLLEVCPGAGFRTLLMSATLAPDTVETITALFGPADRVRMVASLHLRPEPQYWVHRENSSAAKERKVREALRHAPRPFILYVTKRRDARAWLKTLKDAGHQRIALFDGATPDAERQRIIDEWADDRLDGVVATSAFGVGIDKRDVRTVIHAAAPETLDRYYQEVGRGGRDGRVSASLLLYSERDLKVADDLASPTLIGGELAFERWSAMFKAAKSLDNVGVNLTLDLDVVPPRLRQQSDYNSSWNMRTLIMMARANMLELQSRPPAVTAQQVEEAEAEFSARNESYWKRYFAEVTVRMKDLQHRNQDQFESAISNERRRSMNAATMGRDLLGRMLDGDAEVSDLFERLYRSHLPGRAVVISPACGGCPADRAASIRRLPYSRPPAFGIEDVGPVDLSPWRQRFPDIDPKAPVVLVLDDQANEGVIQSVLEDLVSLFGVSEVSVRAAYRTANTGLGRLHQHAAGGVVLIQDLDEELERPQSYQLARATVLPDLGVALPLHLLTLERPLHVLIVRESAVDPQRPDRRMSDTGANVLTLERFKLGAAA